MEKVFYILVIVFAVLFAISLIGAAIFALIGTPEKKSPIENKHRIAKKRANICALVALGSLVLGVLCVFLNDYLIKKARIDSVNSALFGNGESESVSTSFSSDEPSESTSSDVLDSYSETYSSSTSSSEDSTHTSNEVKEKTEAEKISDELSGLIAFSKSSNDTDLLRVADYTSRYVSKLQSGLLTEDEAKELKLFVNTLVYMGIEDNVRSYSVVTGSLGQVNNIDIPEGVPDALTDKLKSITKDFIESVYSHGRAVYGYLEKLYPDGTSVSARKYYTSLGTIFTDKENEDNGFYGAFVETDGNTMIVYIELPSTWSAEQNVSNVLSMFETKDMLEDNIEIIHFRWFKSNGDVVAFASIKKIFG